MIFDFGKKLEESKSGVLMVIKWMTRTVDGFWGYGRVGFVESVETNPSFYYMGDVRFIRLYDRRNMFIELKVETYSSQETPNLAVERWSNTRHGTPGGPWSTRADFYGHIMSDGLLCVAPTQNWCKAISGGETSEFAIFKARNVGYTTAGALIKRSWMADNIANYKEYKIY